MITSYDPANAPDPEAWLATDEHLRLEVVLDFHRRSGERFPNINLHAAAHMVVENQVALGDEIPVAATLRRLMDEGLDRHEAVHAVGSVVMNHIRELMADGMPGHGDPNRGYREKLDRLTVESWLRESG